MKKIRATDDIMPSAMPSAEEMRHWRALPRDEQLEHMKKALGDAAERPRSDRSMQDIKDAALAKIASRENG